MKRWSKRESASGCVHTGQRCHKNSAFLKNRSGDTVYVCNPWTQGQLCPTGYIRCTSGDVCDSITLSSLLCEVHHQRGPLPGILYLHNYSFTAVQVRPPLAGAWGGTGHPWLVTPSVIPLSQNMVGYLPCEGWELSLNSLMSNFECALFSLVCSQLFGLTICYWETKRQIPSALYGQTSFGFYFHFISFLHLGFKCPSRYRSMSMLWQHWGSQWYKVIKK